MYFGDEDWQDAIKRWLSECAAVVIEAGTSGGLNWEIIQVVNKVNPTKVVLLLPLTNAEYRVFLNAVTRLFPKPLPDTLPPSRLLTFSKDWTPLTLQGSSLRETIKPFFDQNGFDFDWWPTPITPVQRQHGWKGFLLDLFWVLRSGPRATPRPTRR
jgi:hypothetical protein